MMNTLCHTTSMLLLWIVILLILYRHDSYPCCYYGTTVDSFKFLNLYRYDVQQQLHRMEGMLLRASSDDYNSMLSSNNNANDQLKKDDVSMNIWSILQSSYDTLLKRDSKPRNDIDIFNSIMYESTTPSLVTFSKNTSVNDSLIDSIMSSFATTMMNNNNNSAAIKASPSMNASSASGIIINDKLNIFSMPSRDQYQQASMSSSVSRYADINNWNNFSDTIRGTSINNSMAVTTTTTITASSTTSLPVGLGSNRSTTNTTSTITSSSSSIALPIVTEDRQQRRGNQSSRLQRWSGNVKHTVKRLFRFKNSNQTGSIVVMTSPPTALISASASLSSRFLSRPRPSSSTSSTINSVIQQRQTSTSKYITTIASNSSVEPKKGFTLMIVRTIRRRLLNIWPRRRTSFEWANSVSSSGLYDMKDKPPRYYKISSANITQSTAGGGMMMNTNLLMSTIQQVNQRMRSTIRRRFILSDTDIDLESSDYMTQYLLSSSVSELAPTSSGLNVLGRNRVIVGDSYGSSNDSGNILARIKNNVMKSITFVSNARYVLYYNQNYLSTSTLNIKSDYRNALVVFNENNNNNSYNNNKNNRSSSTSVMIDNQGVATTVGGTTSDVVKFYIDNVFDAVGAIMEEYRESGYRSVEATKEIISNTTSTMAQNKMLVESVNKVVMSEQSQNVVRGIGATKDTLQSIYLSGVEIAQESSDRFKSLATDNNWALPTIPVLPTFPSFSFLRTFPTIDIQYIKLPWDVYYRGDIPFFENFNSTFQQSTSSSSTSSSSTSSSGSASASIPQLMTPSISTRDIIASMIEAEKKLNDDKTLITTTTSSSIIPLDSMNSSLPKGVKARIIRMLFPVSSLALKGVKFIFSNRMENLTTSVDALRMRLDNQLQHLMTLTPSNQLIDDNQLLQQQQQQSITPSNQSIDEDYSDLFTNDISAISTAWELANPSPDALNTADESNERSSSVAFPKNIVVYSLRKLLISVPVYHVFNAYKYIRKMNRFRNADRNQIVNLAIEDAKSVVVSNNDDNDDGDDDKDASINSKVSEISLLEMNNRDNGLIAKAQEFDGERSLKLLKSIEMKKKPSFIEISSISQPTKADFNYIVAKRIKAALDGAMCVSSHEDVVEFRKYIGLGAVIGALLGKVPEGSNIDRIDAVKALCRVIRYEQVSLSSSSSSSRPIVIEVSSQPAIINVLCDIMEKPFKRFPKIQSQADRDRDLRSQTEAVALVQRLVRSHPDSSKLIGRNTRIRGILNDIIQDDPYSVDAAAAASSSTNIATTTNIPFNLSNVEDTSILKRSTGIYTKYYKVKKTVPANSNNNNNSSYITEYLNLRTSQMAKVAYWSLGGVKWTPRQPGQTGIRILSLDGGGTRGVLSIAYLKEIMARINMNSTVKLEPYQVFDVICGTSTGGIIAVLLGVKRVSVDDAERLYDTFIDQVFDEKSNLRLLLNRAAYDEVQLEGILSKMLGEELFIDSNQNDCPRVFCVSSDLSKVPVQQIIWRNYNFPPDVTPAYSGTSSVKTRVAVRATSAAPTFFTPVVWNNTTVIDGAFTANNPSFTAVNEAMALYPGVDIEMIVSVGTGYLNISIPKTEERHSLMNWLDLVNVLVGAATNSEVIHEIMKSLYKEKYFRFNVGLQKDYAIDEKNKTTLKFFKDSAVQNIRELEEGAEGKTFRGLIKTLQKGGSTVKPFK